MSARIFTAQEELPFAGHPVIGAAAALHERHAIEPVRSWLFVIAGREIAVRDVDPVNRPAVGLEPPHDRSPDPACGAGDERCLQVRT